MIPMKENILYFEKDSVSILISILIDLGRKSINLMKIRSLYKIECDFFQIK